MQVLLADDQPPIRSALRLFLEHKLGIHNVAEVTDAQSLLAFVRATPPDLLLLDWELPGLSDVNVLSSLRDYCPGLVVIALSVQPEARPRALMAGITAFVSKGETPEHLVAILNAFINGGLVKMKQELVKDWMTREVVTIEPDTTLPEAHRLMSERKIRRLPVMEHGRLVGIVTRGDVREAEPSDATTLSIWELNYLLAQLKVEKIMTRNPVTISKEATIGEAAQMMLDKKISGLPVVDSQGKIIGIITESDIFRTVVKQWSMIPVAV